MPPPKTKRSTKIVFGAVGALVLACCGGGFIYERFSVNRQCVDSRDEQVVGDDLCRSNPGGYYRYYYGGRRGGIGTKASGGSYERGGFGSHFTGHGSGG